MAAVLNENESSKCDDIRRCDCMPSFTNEFLELNSSDALATLVSISYHISVMSRPID